MFRPYKYVHACRSPLRRSVITFVTTLLATSSVNEAAPASQPLGTEPATTPAAAPPAYTVIRWNESYAYLRDPSKGIGPIDKIKYIPLNEEGSYYLSLGGQARYRYERFHNANIGNGPQDDNGFHLMRVMAHADLHLGDNFRLFVQAKSSLEDGRFDEPRSSDKDTLDLQQAFADVRVPLSKERGAANEPSLTLRVGRQDLLFGAQRLIAPSDWSNVRRTFEGGRTIVNFSKTHSLDLLLVRPVSVDAEEPNVGEGDVTFAGLYDTIALPGLLPGANTKLELYALGLYRQGVGYAAEPGEVDEDRYTVGARFAGAPKPYDFDLELTYQFGKFGSGDISAWSVATEVGYTVPSKGITPRIYVGFDAASGDNTPGDGDSSTFNQLFPNAHSYFGYVDAIGRQNIIDLHPGVEILLLQNARHVKKLTVRAEQHWFWRQSNDDAAYTSSGTVLRNSLGSNEAYIGSEIDLLVNWQIDQHLSAYFGYSHFNAGDFLDDTGPAKDVDYLYAAVIFTF